MGTFFQKMGGMLKGGFNVLSAPFKAAGSYTSQFFPASQRKVITGAEVSRTPNASTAGYRPQVKGAITLGQRFQSWRGKTYEAGRRIWDGVKTSFMGYSMKDLGGDLGKTAGQIMKETSRAAIATLPDYFMRKWGLKPREQTGERTANTGLPIIYQNETQSNSPATQPSGISDFFGRMFASQPKGTYSIAMPQSQPIPITIPVPISSITKGTSSSMMLIGFLIIAVVGGYFFLKKGK